MESLYISVIDVLVSLAALLKYVVIVVPVLHLVSLVPSLFLLLQFATGKVVSVNNLLLPLLIRRSIELKLPHRLIWLVLDLYERVVIHKAPHLDVPGLAALHVIVIHAALAD